MIELIQERFASYNAANQLQEEYAVKEILQDIALYGLWRAGFFDIAAFQGGTSLHKTWSVPYFLFYFYHLSAPIWGESIKN